MDVTAALLTAAVTVGTLAPSLPSEAPAPAAQSIAAMSTSAGTTAIDAGVVRTPSMRQQPLASAMSQQRPGALIPLYTSLAVLQGLDIYTTSSAISRGGVEANPAMRGVSGTQWGSAAVKAAATAGSIFFIERAWKHNRKGAVILATVINVATAMVVAHNTHVAKP
jgi:uncharacterized protein DUF5658